MIETTTATERTAARGSTLTLVAACIFVAPLGACEGYQGHRDEVDPTPTVDADKEIDEAAIAVSDEMEARAELNAEVAKARMDELEARARKMREDATRNSAEAADDVREEFDEAHAEAKAAFAELSDDADEAGDNAKARMAKALDAMSKELAEWESELEDNTDSPS